MLTVTIFGDSSNNDNHLTRNESFDVAVNIKDIPKMVKSGINGTINYGDDCIDFCGGHIVDEIDGPIAERLGKVVDTLNRDFELYN